MKILRLLITAIFFSQAALAKPVIYLQPQFQNQVEFLSGRGSYSGLAIWLAIQTLNPEMEKEFRDLLSQKNIPAQTRLPKLQLVRNSLSIEGLDKPILLENSEDLIFNIDGKKWKYNHQLSLRENYDKLEKILDPKKTSRKSAWHRLMVPEVNALSTSILLGAVIVVVLSLGLASYMKLRYNGELELSCSADGKAATIDYKREKSRGSEPFLSAKIEADGNRSLISSNGNVRVEDTTRDSLVNYLLNLCDYRKNGDNKQKTELKNFEEFLRKGSPAREIIKRGENSTQYNSRDNTSGQQ